MPDTIKAEKTQEARHMNTILKLEHIQKYYGNEGNLTKAIKDISFTVEAGEFFRHYGSIRLRKNNAAQLHFHD